MYAERMTNATRQLFPELPWFDVANPASPDLDELAKRFGLHPLEIEDCRNRPQRAKLEEYENHVFIVLKHLMQAGEKPKLVYLDEFFSPDVSNTSHDPSCELPGQVWPRAAQEWGSAL